MESKENVLLFALRVGVAVWLPLSWIYTWRCHGFAAGLGWLCATILYIRTSLYEWAINKADDRIAELESLCRRFADVEDADAVLRETDA